MNIYKSNGKKVVTKDLNGNENGYLVELEKDGRKIVSYLTVLYPGSSKGFYAYKILRSTYICIRGQAKVILYTKNTKQEHVLSSDYYDKLHVPINTPVAFKNESVDEVWLINFPDPAYDPFVKDRVDLSEEEAAEWAKNNSYL